MLHTKALTEVMEAVEKSTSQVGDRVSCGETYESAHVEG